MAYRILADFVLALHLAFIVFVVAGGLLALRWRWAPAVHLPAAFWGAFVAVTGRPCPLTPLENSLRQAAGAAGYSGGFIEHYLLPVIYPSALAQGHIQLILAALVIAANVLTYLIVWRHRRNR